MNESQNLRQSFFRVITLLLKWHCTSKAALCICLDYEITLNIESSPMGQVHKCSARKQPNASKGTCTQCDEIFTQPYPNVIEVSNESQLMSVPYSQSVLQSWNEELKATWEMGIALSRNSDGKLCKSRECSMREQKNALFLATRRRLPGM